MRRLLFCMLAVLFLAGSAQAALTYGGTYYRQNKGYALGNVYNVDPIYLFMNEVETEIEASTLEGGTTLTFSTNGGTIDNIVNGDLNFTEASEELRLRFTSNNVELLSRTGVLGLDVNDLYIVFNEITAPTGNPASNQSWLYVKDDTGTTKLYFEDSAGTVTDLLTAGAGNTLDQSYDQGGAGAGRTIDAADGAVAISNDDADAASVLTVSHTGAADGDAITVTVANSSQDAIEIENTGTGYDIEGTGALWYATKTGAITATGLTSTGAAINLNVSSNFATNINTGTSNAAVTIGSGTGTVEIASTGVDISTAGAISGVTTISMSGDLSLATATAIKGTTTTANTISLQVYDNDTGPGYKDAILLTNGNTPAIAIGDGNPTVAINSSDWDIDATGAMTGIGAITSNGLFTGSAGATITGAAVSLNASSNFAVNIGTGTNNSVVTIGGGSGTAAVSTSDWSVTAAGVGTNIDSIAGNNANKIDLTINQRFEFSDNSETFGFDVGTTSNTVEFVTDSGITIVDFNDVDQLIDVEYVTGDNGVKVDVSMDERVEFKDGAESYGFLLSGANTITATTDTGATTFDFNDIDILTGAESITGDAGNKLDFTVNQRFEFSDNSETWGFDVGTTANTVEFVTDSGVNIVDCNNMTLTDYTVTVTDDANGKTLNANESGTVQTNAGAVGAAAWTLPGAAAGLKYTFVVMAAQELRVTPGAGDVININGTAADAAEYWTANAAGECLTLIAVDTTNWIAVSYTGSWTQQTP